jgi:hypothetical protein
MSRMKRRADEPTAPRPRRVDGKVVVTRQQALAKGLKTFFTGEPCANGHVAERLAKRGECLRCYSEREQDPEYRARQNELKRKRYQDDSEYRTSQIERARKSMQNPGYRARQNELNRKRRHERYHQDPEYRARTLELDRKLKRALKAKKSSTARAKPERGAAERSP